MREPARMCQRVQFRRGPSGEREAPERSHAYYHDLLSECPARRASAAAFEPRDLLSTGRGDERGPDGGSCGYAPWDHDRISLAVHCGRTTRHYFARPALMFRAWRPHLVSTRAAEALRRTEVTQRTCREGVPSQALDSCPTRHYRMYIQYTHPASALGRTRYRHSASVLIAYLSLLSLWSAFPAAVRVRSGV